MRYCSYKGVSKAVTTLYVLHVCYCLFLHDELQNMRDIVKIYTVMQGKCTFKQLTLPYR